MILEATRVLSSEDALALWQDMSSNVEAQRSANARRTVLDLPYNPAIIAPCVITEDGQPVMAVGRLRDTERLALTEALLQIPSSTVVRGAGIRSRSTVFGSVARNNLLQRSSCRKCSAALTHPRQHQVIVNIANSLACILHDLVPAQAEANRAAVSEVLPDWLMPGGMWTSGIINYTAALPYHRDRNNFDAWSAMPVVRRWKRGGHLHCPELEVAGHPLVVNCADGNVVLFNGQRLMHGVTPIRDVPGHADGYRMSAVYYPVKKFRTCFSPAEELARGQRNRTEQEHGLIERQRAAGYIVGEQGPEQYIPGGS